MWPFCPHLAHITPHPPVVSTGDPKEGMGYLAIMPEFVIFLLCLALGTPEGMGYTSILPKFGPFLIFPLCSALGTSNCALGHVEGIETPWKDLAHPSYR